MIGPQFRHVYLTVYCEQGGLPFTPAEVNLKTYMSVILMLMTS